MGLRKATTNPALRALDGKWVRLAVGPFAYQLEEVSAAEADAWWADAQARANRRCRAIDLTVTDLRDIEQVVKEGDGVPLREAIRNGGQAPSGPRRPATRC